VAASQPANIMSSHTIHSNDLSLSIWWLERRPASLLMRH
jgi:hypothetical protein